MRTLIALLSLLAWSANALILPADRMGPWARANVGVEGGTPNSSLMTTFTTVSAGASLTTINNALASCPSNQVVQLSAGTYTCAGNISIPTGVVLRGAGMSNTIIVFTSGGISVYSQGIYDALRSANYHGGGTANWTAGYTQGTSNLTFSTTSPGLTVGNYVYLDQANDTFFVNNLGYGGSVVGPRGDTTHAMCQFTKVTAVNGNTVTIWPPVAATWFSSGLNPGAVWIGQSAWISRVGIENLTVDGTQSTGTGGSNIDLECVHDCWVKGVCSLNCRVTHVMFAFGAFRCELRDCYLYGTQGAASQSYGVDLTWASSCLVENNVFEKCVGAILPHSSPSCNVYTYNYVTNEWFAVTGGENFLMAGIQPHESHGYMELSEGNHIPKYNTDFLHGSHSHQVLFRNRITGWEAFSYPSGPTLYSLQCEWIDLTNRYCSSVGNILGTPGIYSILASYPGASQGYNASHVIYTSGISAGGDPYGIGTTFYDDPTAWSTFYRHMDYDTVTGAIYYNPTNADVTLPNSLVYSSMPSWWGCLNWPPFNPTNGVNAALIDPTNIPAGYWRVYGRYPACFPPTITSVEVLSTGKSKTTGRVLFK